MHGWTGVRGYEKQSEHETFSALPSWYTDSRLIKITDEFNVQHSDEGQTGMLYIGETHSL